MKFDATLYLMPDTIRIHDVEARDEDEAYDRALEIAIRKYTRIGWELDHLEIEEVDACPGE